MVMLPLNVPPKGKVDNRLENILFLCPNCHAQTDNWGGRNVRRVMKTPAHG